MSAALVQARREARRHLATAVAMQVVLLKDERLTEVRLLGLLDAAVIQAERPQEVLSRMAAARVGAVAVLRAVKAGRYGDLPTATAALREAIDGVHVGSADEALAALREARSGVVQALGARDVERLAGALWTAALAAARTVLASPVGAVGGAR